MPNVWHVVQGMRAQDWQEVVNLVPAQFASVDGITMLAVSHSVFGFVLKLDQVPVVVVHFAQKHPGTLSAGMFATDQFNDVWRQLVRELREFALPALLELGTTYCEAHVMASNLEAQRFLRYIGFTQRSDVLKKYGAFDKDFVLYAISEEELPNVFRSRTAPRSRAS